jgi:hypothetical protein
MPAFCNKRRRAGEAEAKTNFVIRHSSYVILASRKEANYIICSVCCIDLDK